MYAENIFSIILIVGAIIANLNSKNREKMSFAMSRVIFAIIILCVALVACRPESNSSRREIVENEVDGLYQLLIETLKTQE